MTHGRNEKNFEIFSAEEFIAAITQHIPDKHSRIGVRDKLQMVRYYGWYSTGSRGESIKARLLRPGDEPPSSLVTPDVTVLDVSDHQPRWARSKAWRELIKKIWEVDPLCCLKSVKKRFLMSRSPGGACLEMTTNRRIYRITRAGFGQSGRFAVISRLPQ
jgi:hypothetical protein